MPADRSAHLPNDGAFLAAAAKCTEDPRTIVPFTYREPLSPLVAARRENRPVQIGKIVAAYDRLDEKYERVLVEGAGGLSVSLTDAIDMAGLAARLQLPLLIVARPSLGTLNHTYLTVRYARSNDLPIVGVILCASRPLDGSIAEATNPSQLEEKCGIPVLGTVPYAVGETVPDALAQSEAPAQVDPLAHPDGEHRSLTPEAAAEAVERGINMDMLLRRLADTTN